MQESTRSASREWCEPGGVNPLKFPFELQAETIHVGCAGSPPLQGKAYYCTLLSRVFTNLSGTAQRITLRLIADEGFFIFIRRYRYDYCNE